MKVSSFHLAGKVEESVRSYLSNSFVFSTRNVEVDRVVDFRAGQTSLQFFMTDDNGERMPMGGMDFATVQERDGKIAFQCRMNVQPSGYVKQFFLMMGAESEQYVHYSNLAELLRKQWEKNIEAYLPKGGDGMPMMPIAATSEHDPDDEYEGLTPEEIEAVTGVRPQPKGVSAQPRFMPAEDKPLSAKEQADEDEIARLMSMMSGIAQESSKEESGNMSMDEIEALAREVSAPPPAPSRGPKSKAKDPEPAQAEDIMSAEDIWKQITGGK